MIETGISALALVIALAAIVLAATIPLPQSIINDDKVSNSTVYSSLMTEKRLQQVSRKIDLNRIARKIIETDMDGLASHVTADLMTNYLPQFSGSVAGNLADDEQFTNEMATRLETSQVFAQNVANAINAELISQLLANNPEFVSDVAQDLDLNELAQVITIDPNFRSGVADILGEDGNFATLVSNRIDLALLAETVAPIVSQSLANNPTFIAAVVADLDVDHLVDEIAAKVVEDPNLLANVSNYLLTQTDMINQIVAQLDISQIAAAVIQDPQLPQMVGDYLAQDSNFQQIVIAGVLQDPNFVPNVATSVIQDPQFQETISEHLIQSQEFQATVINGLLQDPDFINQISGNISTDADFRQAISMALSQDTQFQAALSGLLAGDNNFVQVVSMVVAQEVDINQIAQIIVDNNWPQIEQLIIQTIQDQPLGQLSVNTLIVNNQLTAHGNTSINNLTGDTILNGSILRSDGTRFLINGQTSAMHAGVMNIGARLEVSAIHSNPEFTPATIGFWNTIRERTGNWTITTAGNATFNSVHTNELHSHDGDEIIAMNDIRGSYTTSNITGGKIWSQYLTPIRREDGDPNNTGESVIFTWDANDPVNENQFVIGDQHIDAWKMSLILSRGLFNPQQSEPVLRSLADEGITFDKVAELGNPDSSGTRSDFEVLRTLSAHTLENGSGHHNRFRTMIYNHEGQLPETIRLDTYPSTIA